MSCLVHMLPGLTVYVQWLTDHICVCVCPVVDLLLGLVSWARVCVCPVVDLLQGLVSWMYVCVSSGRLVTGSCKLGMCVCVCVSSGRLVTRSSL